MSNQLFIRPIDREGAQLLGKIFKEIPETFYPCNDGMYSTHDRRGACNYHKGLHSSKKLVPVNQKKSNLVQLVNLSDIYTNKKLFQNRKADYSIQTVDRILNAVNNGTFKIEVFDPIILWHNPSDSKLYILSGHSRVEAFRRLSKMGFDTFDSIPAKIINTNEDNARKIAMESNALATREKETERALYYKELRESGVRRDEIENKAKELEGDNANRIIAYSYLSRNGRAFAALEALETGDEASKNIVKTIATWTGEAMRRYFLEFSTMHENEIFDWLKKSAYGTGAGQISNKQDFFKRLEIAVSRNTTFNNFDKDSRLNLVNSTGKNSIETEYDLLVEKAKRELSIRKTERDNKLKEFTQRGATGEWLDKAMKAYNDSVTVAQRSLLDIMKRKGEVLEARKNQSELFGLGRIPEMKLIFRTNDEMLEFGQLYKNYVDKAGTQKFDDYLRKFLSDNRIKPIDPNLNGLSGDFMRQPTYQILKDYRDLFVPKVDGNTTILIKRTANLDDTLRAIKQVVREYRSEVAPLAEHLKDPNGNALQTFYNVWHWTFNNITYKLDEIGKEQLRTPYRSWVDRHTGSDCDCMTILTSCILVNQGFEPKPLVVGQNYASNYSHIFTTVQGYAIDPVPPLKNFNQVAPNITKIMMLELLAGVDGEEAQPVICGLGAVAPATDVTKDLINKQSYLLRRIKAGDNSRATRNEFSKIRYAVMLNGTDEQGVFLDVADDVSHINTMGEVVLYSDADDDEINEYVESMLSETLDGLGRSKKRQQRRERRKEKINNLKKKVSINTAKKVVKQTANKAVKTVKRVSKEAGKVIKKINRLNPVTVAARYAFLALVRVNFLKISTSLKWGYLDEKTAQSKGVNMDEWRKLVNARKGIEKLFVGFGGKPNELKKIVMKGGKAGSDFEKDTSVLKVGEGINRFDIINGLEGLGVAAESSAATAAPLLIKVKSLLSKINFKKLFEGIKTISKNKNVQDFVKNKVADKFKKKNKSLLSPENDGFKDEQEREQVLTYDANSPAADFLAPSGANPNAKVEEEFSASNNSDSTASQTSEDAAAQNNTTPEAKEGDAPDDEKKSNGWILPAVIGVGLLIALSQ